MGKLFLYGRTETKNRINPYAKLTVNCPPNVIVRAESTETYYRLDVPSGAEGRAIFEKLNEGEWKLSFADMIYSPSQIVAISNLNYEITLGIENAMTYNLRPEPPENGVTIIEDTFTATINVVYPEGSICTCSDGITILTANDTNGTYTFILPNAGDWTVSCSNGNKTASALVNIIEAYQSENIILDYTRYIYNSGKEYVVCNVNATKGDVTKDYNTIAFNVTEPSNGQIGPSYITATKLNLSDIDTINVSCVSSSTSDYRFVLCIRENNDIVDNFEEDCVAYAQLNNTTGLLSLDVSNFYDSYFIEIIYHSAEPSTGMIDSIYYI